MKAVGSMKSGGLAHRGVMTLVARGVLTPPEAQAMLAPIPSQGAV